MKKIILLIVIGWMLWGCGSSDSSATVMVTPNPGQTAACVPGYIRTTPNFCLRNSDITPAYGAWGNATACTNRTFYTGTADPVPALASAVLLEIFWQGLSSNAVGMRQNSVSFYNAVGCSGNGNYYDKGFYEFVATVAGTNIGQISLVYMVRPTGSNQFTTSQGNAGGNGNASIVGQSVIGYYDQ